MTSAPVVGVGRDAGHVAKAIAARAVASDVEEWSSGSLPIEPIQARK